MRNILCPRVKTARWSKTENCTGKDTALLVVLRDVHVRSVCLRSARLSVAIKIVFICSFLRSPIFNKIYAFVVSKKGGAT